MPNTVQVLGGRESMVLSRHTSSFDVLIKESLYTMTFRSKVCFRIHQGLCFLLPNFSDSFVAEK